jgi:hypothetical protein
MKISSLIYSPNVLLSALLRFFRFQVEYQTGIGERYFYGRDRPFNL